MSLKDAVYGFAVGDALGVPYEFKERDTFECKGMNQIGNGTWGQKAGTWSDDTSMLLATCDSIRINDGNIDLDDIMRRFLRWRYDGEYTARGKVFDVGNTTAKAISRYSKGWEASKCGCSEWYANGNGSLMRILPLAYLKEITANDVKNVSKLTHSHEISIKKCQEYINFCMEFEKGNFDIPSEIANRTREEIKSTTFVVDTIDAALWCVANTDNYKDCVLTAVNLGGDTDTIAAVAGGLAGIKYGFNSIPKEWIETLANKNLINKCLF